LASGETGGGERRCLLTPGSLAGFKMYGHQKKKKIERDEVGGKKGGKKRGKKALLAVAFSSGALGEAPSMAAVPVCVCVCV